MRLCLLFLSLLLVMESKLLATDVCRQSFEEQAEGRSLLEEFTLSKPSNTKRSAVGVEWEGALPLEIYKQLPQLVAQKLINDYSRAEVTVGKKEDDTRFVELMTDSGMQRIHFPVEYFAIPFGYKATEFSSHIIRNKKDLVLLSHMFEIMRDLGAVLSKEAGIHFHLDANNITNIELLVFINIMSSLREQVKTRWGINEDRSIYLNEFSESSLELLQSEPNVDFTDSFYLQKEFYVHLNRFIRYSESYNTIEIRFFDTSLSYVQVLEYLHLTKAVYESIRTRDPILMEALESRKPLEIDFFIKNFPLHF